MSSSKVIANLRVDSLLKQQAREVAQQMWISLSTVMTLLLRKFVCEKKLEIWLDENGFTPQKNKIMQTALHDVRKKGKKINSLQEILDE